MPTLRLTYVKYIKCVMTSFFQNILPSSIMTHDYVTMWLWAVASCQTLDLKLKIK